MKKTFQLLAGLFLGGLLAATAARGQAVPYTFVTIAGTALDYGTQDGTNGTARFDYPSSVTEDGAGNLYVADSYNYAIRKIRPVGTNWVTSTIAGTAGTPGTQNGTNNAAQFNDPTGVTMDTNGNLYVADTGSHTIRKITPVGTNWVTATIAGTAGNYGGNDGTNGAAQFFYPYGITVDTNGNLYVADADNNAIRKITPVGTNWVTVTIAGKTGSSPGTHDGTNGAAQFDGPSGIAVDGADNLFVADAGNNAIRKITPVGTNWVTVTIAGTTGSAGGGNDGTNGAAQFNGPLGIAVDGADNLYVADSSNDTIRKITPVGTNWVTVTIGGVVGDGNSADGQGTNALFNFPWGINVDPAGNVHVADGANFTIRLGRVAAVPNLAVGFTAPASVVVSWPNTGGFTLQTNGNLTTANWAAYGGTVTTSNGTNSVTLTPAAGNLFFRLQN